MYDILWTYNVPGFLIFFKNVNISRKYSFTYVICYWKFQISTHYSFRIVTVSLKALFCNYNYLLKLPTVSYVQWLNFFLSDMLKRLDSQCLSINKYNSQNNKLYQVYSNAYNMFYLEFIFVVLIMQWKSCMEFSAR